MMISRVAFAARTCAAIAKRCGGRRMAHDAHHPIPWRLPTMDDLPIPSGSWQAAYNSKQQKLNIQLLASVIFFLGTIGYVVKADIIDLNLPPRMKN